jgi:hypothetical protein
MVRIPKTPATYLMLGVAGIAFGISFIWLFLLGGGWLAMMFGLILLLLGLSGLFSCASMRRNGVGWWKGP